MRSVLLCILSFTLFVAVSAPAHSQETTGRLEGRVLDASGQPIPYVNVMVNGAALQGTRGTLTSSQGRFAMLALPVGEYTVSISHVSYQERRFDPVRIRLGQTSTLGNVTLEERIYTTREIVVEAEAPLLDPATTYMGANLPAERYELLPIDRDYRAVAAILPEANSSYFGDGTNFAGSTGLENRFLIDGLDATDPVRNLTGTSLPYNFLQEVEVRSGGYEAEYGGSLGGTVNAVTYSGGNERTYQAFGFFTNADLSARPRTGTGEGEKGSVRNYDVGFGMGGPIMKDRLWYYLAYNPKVAGQDVEVPGWGVYDDHTTTHIFAAKLTWQANKRNSLVLSAFGDPSERHAVNGTFIMDGEPAALSNIDPALTNIRSGGVNVVLSGHHLIRDNFLVTTSLSRATRVDENTPETGATDVWFADRIAQTFSGGPSIDERNRSTVTRAAVTGTWIREDHEIKAGLEYLDNRWYIDSDAVELTLNPDSTYDLWHSYALGRVGSRIPSAFLQDSWRLGERLRINIGLRWDGQFIVSSDGTVAQSILDQWQPRAGLVYQPGPLGRQKLFASYGRFYQNLSTWPLFLYYNESSLWSWQSYDHDPRIDPSGGEGWELGGAIQPEIDGMKGQYSDEYTLGYERLLAEETTVGVRGVYRSLRQGLEDGEIALGSNVFEFGNPGLGGLSAYPRAKREYTALELTITQEAWKRLVIMASYVLSRNSGNYPGLFNSDYGYLAPNANGSFDILEGENYWDGLLPNDRTHVFKISGSYRSPFDVTIGASAFWESGTPMTDFGPSASGFGQDMFIGQRGTAGRTPSVWDMNLRIIYEPRFVAIGNRHPRLMADILHLGNPRRVIGYDQKRYLNIDEEGTFIDPNPNYRREISWQPPMYVRFGLEVRI